MLRIVSKNRILAICDGCALIYSKGNLFIKDIRQNKKEKYLLKLPIGFLNQLLVPSRLFERLLRMEPRLSIALDRSTFLLSCMGKIYRVDVKKNEIVEELQLRSHMNNPLMFARKANGNVLFGEYFSNNNHESVSVFEREFGFWKKVYSFPAGSVYHIHGIVIEDNKIYILTGDEDKESAIWYTEDNFAHVKMLVGGSQQYRACVAYPYKNGLIYATDTPLEQNYLYYLKPQDGTWKNEVLCELPGPCIYGTMRENCFYFATSVEPDSSLSGWRYRFSYRLGKGVKDRYTHVFQYAHDGEVVEVARFKKDLWPMVLFQFGNCLFPDVALDEDLLMCPQSVKKYDNKTLKI